MLGSTRSARLRRTRLHRWDRPFPRTGCNLLCVHHPIQGPSARQESEAHAGLVFILLASIAHAGQAVTADSAGSTGDPSADLPFAFDGPPVPVAPDVIARDAEGRVTLRAVRLSSPIRLDGQLDEGSTPRRRRSRTSFRWSQSRARSRPRRRKAGSLINDSLLIGDSRLLIWFRSSVINNQYSSIINESKIKDPKINNA